VGEGDAGNRVYQMHANYQMLPSRRRLSPARPVQPDETR